MKDIRRSLRHSIGSTKDSTVEIAHSVKERIVKTVSNGKPVSKPKTDVKYESLSDGKYGKIEPESGQKCDEGGPTRYYDCCDRINKCTSRHVCKCSIPQRYVTALLASLGFLISFGIRTNMGIAIIKMVEVTNTTITTGNITTNASLQMFPWNSNIQGLLESSFFWGYIVTQIPGGYLSSILPANRFWHHVLQHEAAVVMYMFCTASEVMGTNKLKILDEKSGSVKAGLHRVFGCAITASAFINLLLPSACKVHYGAAMAVRITQGLIEGVTYPACHGIWRYWAPPLERSRLATIAFCGSYAGAVVGLPLSSVLTQYLGWEACFYFYGALGLTWGTIWWFMSFERPSTHPRISVAEREYIEESLGLADNTAIKFAHTPWKSIFTSMPVYAIIVANFCRSWTFYLLLVNQTQYLKEVFNLTIASAGGIGLLPHLVMACVVPFGGFIADILRSRQILSTTNVRKLFNCTGFGLEATFLLVVGFSSQPTAAITALIFAVGFSGFAITGYNVNHLDIAPRYASILMGLSNGVGTLSGIICPVITTKLTEDKSKIHLDWKWVFLIAGIIHYLGILFYGIFASGEKQPWANPAELQEEEVKDNLSKYGSVQGSQYSLNSTPCNYSEIQTRAQLETGRVATSDVDEADEEDTESADSSDVDDSTSSGSGGPYTVHDTTPTPPTAPVRPAPRSSR